MWKYDESKQIGINYNEQSNVEDYDGNMSFRDLDAEAAELNNSLSITEDDYVLEIGAGTGEIALRIARHCKQLDAWDASDKMLDCAQRKAHAKGIENIAFFNKGFLEPHVEPKRYDKIYSKFALHHLPDFWKQIAFGNIYSMLSSNGLFVLEDVIFSFSADEYEKSIDTWIDNMRQSVGERIAEEVALHVREEYSTWDWITEGMAEKAGLSLERKMVKTDFIAQYVFKKEG